MESKFCLMGSSTFCCSAWLWGGNIFSLFFPSIFFSSFYFLRILFFARLLLSFSFALITVLLLVYFYTLFHCLSCSLFFLSHLRIE
ncbi:hypothetical protein V8C35DRAFT_272665 [Trichoderma chlorosporum]